MKPDLNIIPEPNPYNTPANIAAKRRSLLSIFRVWLIFAVNSTKNGNIFRNKQFILSRKKIMERMKEIKGINE